LKNLIVDSQFETKGEMIATVNTNMINDCNDLVVLCDVLVLVLLYIAYYADRRRVWCTVKFSKN